MAIGFAVVVAVVAVVPPLRNAALLAGSRVVLFLASPLAPDIKGFEALPVASKIHAVDGTLLGTAGGERREPATLKSLPEHVRHAVLAAEDARFYEHDGVDPTGIIRAVVRSSQGQKQGGSTITQQLAKINYTESERTMLRKLREVMYATKLEDNYTKDQLLERYMNQVYFGDGAYGIAMAARSYFGVDPKNLTADQAATLAGIIRAPEAYDARAKPAVVKARRDQVLGNMQRHGWLDETTARAAKQAPLAVAPLNPSPDAIKAPHFVEFVRREASELDALGGSAESRAHQLVSGGYTIETTLDVKAFDAAEATVREQLGQPGDPTTAVVSVQPGDGAIRALVGGLDAAQRFDVATQGTRQPGSSFKPFVYLAALRDGIDPRSVFDTTSPRPMNYKGEAYTVDNYEGAGSGHATVDDALVQSINTVYAQLVIETGPADAVDAAVRSGIDEARTRRDRDRPAVALGGLTSGATPLEMAAAYATFAAQGEYARPYAIARIVDRRGREVYAKKIERTRAFEATEVAVMNRPLIDVVQQGTGVAARFGPRGAVAGKTGTTQKYADAWFVGYTTKLATSVWVGYPEALKPMTDVHGRKVSGGSFPAAIFGDYMPKALAGQSLPRLPTASPDELDLRMITPSTTTSSSSTTSSSTSSSTTAPLQPGTTAYTPPPPPPRQNTTTTKKPTTTTTTGRTTTSTTTKKTQEATTSTTR